MDQNGNQSSRPKTNGEFLKEWADMARAQERAEIEARRLGLPPPIMAGLKTETHAEAIERSLSQVNTNETDDAILTSAEAAKLLGYSEKSFRNAVSLGKIPHYKLMGQNRFKKSELLGLLVRVE